MRDIVFLVADKAMQQLVHGFFGRKQFHRTLGCGSFDFDPRRDVAHGTSSDSWVYRNAREVLSLYVRTHQHAVVMVDDAWDGSPGPDKIREDISRALKDEWEHRHKVIVLEPELEAWLWQENPNLGAELGCRDFRKILAESGHWPIGQSKPTDPKAALKYLGKHHRADTSQGMFKRVSGLVSVKHCTDPAFLSLRDSLRDWFEEDRL